MSQQAEEYKTPIYLVTGFLESGKTSLIKNMLEDEDFWRGLEESCAEGERGRCAEEAWNPGDGCPF